MNQEKVWDAISRNWNEFRVRRIPAVEEFVFGKKGKILDLGCGSGRNFMEVENLEWSAVDFSAEMVGYAKKKADDFGMDVNVIKADSAKLPFGNGSFDAVVCFAVIHCIDIEAKRKKTAKEIFRVLKSGGEALISVWGKASARLKNKDKECYVPWTLKYMKEAQMRYTYVYDLKEFVGLMESVGFEIVRSWEDENVNVIVRKP